MSILGTGIDLVHVPGFAEQWRQPGTHLARVFTAGELNDSDGGRAERGIASLAARWAAKEAFIKAWSETLWGAPPVASENIHHLIEVITDAWGRPRIAWHRSLDTHLEGVSAHLSLSHDGDYAIATVLLRLA